MINEIELTKPYFIISLDFELMWGVFDKRNIKNYGQNVEGVHAVIPKILDLFQEYNIHATWATVGNLYFSNLQDLKSKLSINYPKYIDQNLSSYLHSKTITENLFNKYYSGIDLIKSINNTNNQEIATHTFSHYYCLEKGQTLSEFKDDIKKAIDIAKDNNIETNTIIFPRNQYSFEYLNICKIHGIKYFRGNENNFLNKPRSQNELSLLIRSLRLLDTYFNISGSNTFNKIVNINQTLFNIPASFFFRPFNPKLKYLEFLKLRRYKHAMLNAARKNQTFHLWWHPHNFGVNQNQNLSQLRDILEYYNFLNNKYGMISRNINEICKENGI
jgi:peptidoglycan/xylan/chitin deacetylase (PgdA/CDA1 family)